MKHATKREHIPRPLTEKERLITRWLIEHAEISKEERKRYLNQLEAATVIRKCECGCASIDFAISGVASKAYDPLHPFGDFTAKDNQFGVFVFSKQNSLAGVEIYPLAELNLPSEFPCPSELTGWVDPNST